MIICDRRHLVKNYINDREMIPREQTARNVFVNIRENKSCALARMYSQTALYQERFSCIPWTERVNHERSLEFRAWYSWDRCGEEYFLVSGAKDSCCSSCTPCRCFHAFFFLSLTSSSLSVYFFIPISSCDKIYFFLFLLTKSGDDKHTFGDKIFYI